MSEIEAFGVWVKSPPIVKYQQKPIASQDSCLFLTQVPAKSADKPQVRRDRIRSAFSLVSYLPEKYYDCCVVCKVWNKTNIYFGYVGSVSLQQKLICKNHIEFTATRANIAKFNAWVIQMSCCLGYVLGKFLYEIRVFWRNLNQFFLLLHSPCFSLFQFTYLAQTRSWSHSLEEHRNNYTLRRILK